jgi:DNA-binding transcriptional LysR family regulator
MGGLRSTMADWDDMRFFLAVARAGSLSGAARELSVAQPTVGRRIAAFEGRLGAKLFTSTPSGQTLSATGRKMLAHAAQMDLDAIAAERLAAGRDAGLRGQVRITASEWVIDRVLCPLLSTFVDRYPGLEIDLVAEARHLNLVRREADIAIRPSRFEHQDVVQREVATLAFALYASDAYLAEHGSPDFTERCAGHRLIAMSETLGKIPDARWIPEVASRATVVARTNGRMPMATMAASGIGIACLPRFVGDATPTLRLLPTPGPRPERSLWLALHQDARAVPRVKTAAAFFGDSIARLRHALCPRS